PWGLGPARGGGFRAWPAGAFTLGEWPSPRPAPPMCCGARGQPGGPQGPGAAGAATLGNLWPGSVVSASPHTPASGPFLLVTTPPMSSLSICTAPGGAGWADCGAGCADGRGAGQTVSSMAETTSAVPE